MKNLNEELKYSKKGITLISLVVTIIVLLILAGVTIATLTGDNGILNKATEAKNKTEESQEKESLELAITSSQMEDVNTLKISKENLENAIKQQFGDNKDFTVTDNNDGSFLVNMNDTQRMYYLDESGKIIDKNKMLKISTADELKAFRDDVNSGNTYEGWYIYLANDITFDNLENTENWNPIGNLIDYNSNPYDDINMRFKGIFDGCNYEINGIYIQTSNKVQGLFGLVDNGTIKNLIIGENSSINGGNATGSIVGYLYNGSTISNCSNKSNVSGSFVGGIVGCVYTNSKVINSYNLGTLKGDINSGGISGILTTNSIIQNCYNCGNITIVNGGVGGIAGENNKNSIIEKCYNNGIVSGTSFCGGVVGRNFDNSTVRLCYNTKNIIGTSNDIRGIVGVNYTNSILTNCYNIGEIQASGNRIGGVTGYNQGGEVSNCYNIAQITTTDATNVGGVIGFIINNSIEKNNYFLENIVNNGNGSIIEGIESKTSVEMKSLAIVLGTAFKNDTNIINDGYPILNWQ